jgi:peptidoglycan/LPS O-acetylase OafA/YrhL
MRSVRINLAPSIQAGRRIPAVDEIKGLALLLILTYHCGGVLGYANVIHGEIGVDLFLILSGFTLAAYSAAIPLREFVLRRLLRIYPSYWIALLLFGYLDAHYLGGPRPWESVWQHIVGIHGFSRPEYFSDFSDSFWFISLILAAYAVFACIRGRLDNLSLVFAVCGLLTLAASVTYQHFNHVGGLISLAVRIPSFFAGVVGGRLLGSGTAEIRFNLWAAVGLLSFYYLTFFRGVTCGYTIPALGIVLAWLGLRSLVMRVPGGRLVLAAFALTGVISYEVYLFHQPLIRDMNLFAYHIFLKTPAPSRGQILDGILVALGITLVISVAVHLLVSRLFRFLGSRSALERAPVRC